jgi:hypothetical protein
MMKTSPVNLLTYSNFSGAPGGLGIRPTGWSQSGAQANTVQIIASSSLSDPVAGCQTVAFRRISGTGVEGIQLSAATVTSTGTYTVSAYVRVPTGVTAAAFVFYAGTGTPSQSTIASAAVLNAQAKDTWVRYSLTITFSGVPNANSLVASDAAIGTGFDIAAPQLELGSTATTYIPTTTAASGAPRFDYDPVTLAPRGLLIEESRANYTLNGRDLSAWFIVTGIASRLRNQIGIDGLANTANKLVEDSSNGPHGVAVSVPMISSTSGTFTASAYGKVAERSILNLYMDNGSGVSVAYDFDLVGLTATQRNLNVAWTSPVTTVTAVGGGYVRCTLTATRAAADSVYVRVAIGKAGSTWSFGQPSYAGDGTSGIVVDGVQLEVGAFATSIIPTTTTSLTRAADAASMTGTNFSSWFNATEGTFVVAGDRYAGQTSFGGLVSANAGSTTDEIYLTNQGGQGMFFTRKTAGNPGDLITAGAWTLGAIGKITGAYVLNNLGASANGTTTSTDVTADIPTVNQLNIGLRAANSGWLNGHIQSIVYYNKRLPDQTLRALSAQ